MKRGLLAVLALEIALVPAASYSQKADASGETGHTGPVSSVCFSPDGKTLASGSFDHTIKLWDVATGKELRSPGTSDTSTP